MRDLLIAGASAALILLSSGGAYAAGSAPSGLRQAIDRFQATPVARVCREFCREGVCRRRCYWEGENEGYYERRRVYRERDRYDYPRRYDRRRYGDGPGVRFHLDLD